MFDKYLTIAHIIFLFAGLALGGVIMRQWDSTILEEKLKEQREDLIETARPYLPPESGELMSLNGYIDEIGTDKILLRADRVHAHPFEEPGPEMRTVLLTDQTKIYRRAPKDPVVLRVEEKTFFAIPAEKREEDRLLPPDPFERRLVSADALYVGQRVVIFADENVKYSEEFIASSIEFRED